jgi:urease accessory protein
MSAAAHVIRSFRAHATVATAPAPGGVTVLETLRSDPPLTLRQTGPGLVHLVSTGAGPLAGDELRLDLDVAAGTTLEVRSVASTLVLPGAPPGSHSSGSITGESTMVINARVGPGATLRFAPEPTVLAAGCSHRMVVRLSLAAGASAYWREEIVFGRHGERPGRCHSRFDAVIDGTPLLRQELVVGDPSVDRSPAVYGDARCVGSVLVAGPDHDAGAVRRGNPGGGGDEKAEHRAVIGEGWAALPLAGPGVLVSALAPDAVELRRRLALGERHVPHGTCPTQDRTDLEDRPAGR